METKGVDKEVVLDRWGGCEHQLRLRSSSANSVQFYEKDKGDVASNLTLQCFRQ